MLAAGRALRRRLGLSRRAACSIASTSAIASACGRFARRRSGIFRSSWRSALAAALVAALLYLTVHAVLLGPVYEWGAARAGSERNAFFLRVGLYLVFGALLATVSIVADYARVNCVRAERVSLADACRGAMTFVRAHQAAVIGVYVLTGALFVLLLILYGLADRRFGGWRGVVVGQAYIVARLAIRLTSLASEMQLFRRLSGVQATSRVRENPGPPAADVTTAVAALAGADPERKQIGARQREAEANRLSAQRVERRLALPGHAMTRRVAGHGRHPIGRERRDRAAVRIEHVDAQRAFDIRIDEQVAA